MSADVTSAEGPTPSPATTGPVIVTVHGTNDHHPDDDGERWWQRGSRFTDYLTGVLTERGMADAEIVPLHWSGMNSDHDRLRGAQALAKLLRQIEASGRPYAILAHSHGGNVAVEAVSRLRPSEGRGGIVSFGTPFFVRRLKPVPWLIALFQLVMGIVIAPIMIWYLVTAVGSGTSKIVEALVFFGGLLLLAAWSAVRGFRTLAHHGLAGWRCRKGLVPGQWLVVHSPRDEAMKLLETAVAISPQYVTVGAAMRTLTGFARLAAVVGTIAAFTWTARYFLSPIVTKVSSGQFGLGTAADLTFLLLVPLVYGAIFLVLWLIARFGGAWLWAKILTAAIHGGMVGAAYGGDDGYTLTGVTRAPPYGIEPEEIRIEASNLGGIDDQAIFSAAHKLYTAVVESSETDGAGLADPDTMWKHLSDALYHNAYMRDAEVLSTVADHLIQCWRK